MISIYTFGNELTTTLAAAGVQNKFDKMIPSSRTPCSFNTATA